MPATGWRMDQWSWRSREVRGAWFVLAPESRRNSSWERCASATRSSWPAVRGCRYRDRGLRGHRARGAPVAGRACSRAGRGRAGRGCVAPSPWRPGSASAACPGSGPSSAVLAFVVILAMALNDLAALLQTTALRDLAIYLRAGWLFDDHGSVYLDRADGAASGRRGTAAVPLSALHAAVLRLAGAASLRRLSWHSGWARQCLPSLHRCGSSACRGAGRPCSCSGHRSRRASMWGTWRCRRCCCSRAGRGSRQRCRSRRPSSSRARSRRCGWPANAAGGPSRFPRRRPSGSWSSRCRPSARPAGASGSGVCCSSRRPSTGCPGLYGLALPNLIGPAASVAVALGVLVFALRRRGPEGLARLGLATIVASPSLYSHGFLLGLPALLRLPSMWFWTAIGLTCSVWGPGWWGAVGLAVGAWFVPELARRAAHDDALHPLGEAAEPWPTAPRWQGLAPKPAGAPVGARLQT